MPSTEIILTENVPGLGAEADVVKVRRGYARNYLLPRGKAYEVTLATLRQLDNLKKKRAEREARELNEAEELARRINKLRIIFKLETGETGKAFGSITAHDIVTRLKNEIGHEIDRHKVHLEHPIKTTGEHEVQIRLQRRARTRNGNRCRALKVPETVLRSLAKQRRMALAEARPEGVAEKFFIVRSQVRHRIFTAPRPIALRRSRAYWVRC